MSRWWKHTDCVTHVNVLCRGAYLARSRLPPITHTHPMATNSADGSAKGGLAGGQLGLRAGHLGSLFITVLAGTLWILGVYGTLPASTLLGDVDVLYVGMKPAAVITWVLWGLLAVALLRGGQVEVRERSRVLHAIAFLGIVADVATLVGILLLAFEVMMWAFVFFALAAALYTLAYWRMNGVPLMLDARGKGVQYQPLQTYILAIVPFGAYAGWLVHISLSILDLYATKEGIAWFTGTDTRGALVLASINTVVAAFTTIRLVEGSFSLATFCALVAIKITHGPTYILDSDTPVWYLGILTGIVGILLLRYTLARLVVTLAAQAQFDRLNAPDCPSDEESTQTLIGTRAQARRKVASKMEW